MKQTTLAMILLLSLASFQSLAATKLSNCPSTHGASIQEFFWKSDVNGGSGPEYSLSSGQTLSNAGSVCQPGPVLKVEGWTSELKTEINPAKSVKSFAAIKTPEELIKFLNTFGVRIEEHGQLNKAVKNYLSTPNSFILVGKSGINALVVLANSDGKNRYATFMSFRQGVSEQ